MKTIGSDAWNFPYYDNNQQYEINKDTGTSSYLQMNIVQIGQHSGQQADVFYTMVNFSGEYLDIEIKGDQNPLNPPIYIYKRM